MRVFACDPTAALHLAISNSFSNSFPTAEYFLEKPPRAIPNSYPKATYVDQDAGKQPVSQRSLVPVRVSTATHTSVLSNSLSKSTLWNVKRAKSPNSVRKIWARNVSKRNQLMTIA